MQNKFPPLALAAAFALASTAHAAHATAEEGGHSHNDGGDWQLDDPYLGKPLTNDESSFKVDRVLLAGAV